MTETCVDKLRYEIYFGLPRLRNSHFPLGAGLVAPFLHEHVNYFRAGAEQVADTSDSSMFSSGSYI